MAKQIDTRLTQVEWARKGGYARAKALSQTRRRAIARQGAAARWKKAKRGALLD